MVTVVVKRDGKKQKFDRGKIEAAVMNAFAEADGGEQNPFAQNKAHEISKYVEEHGYDNMSVEEIQDIVENKLMLSSRKDVAKTYIIYRNDRNRERERRSALIRQVGEKISATDVQNQNANVDEHSFGGRKGEADGVLMKKFALDYIISPMARSNHENNEIYIHDLDSYAVGMHNCFQRDTTFITDEGIRAFSDFVDGSTVRVLDMNGDWRDAVVRYYGKKPMVKVTLQRSGLDYYHEVNCTEDHRWILSDGTVTTTLSVGDRLFPLKDSSIKHEINSKREAEMFCFGFVLADGCDHIRNDLLSVQVRLCGDKKKYEKYFNIADYRQNTVKGSDDIIYTKRSDIGKQEFLSHNMWRLLSFEDKVAIFLGYISADGSHTTNTKFAWTSDGRILRFIQEVGPLAGYHIYKIKKKEGGTNYKEDRVLYEITFTNKYSVNTTWEVKEISKQPNSEYEAWCVEEPITHSFTLEGGIVTGNCLTIPFDKLLAEGFNTRQTDVRPANSINTAFQLVAVIFQLQSLQQFGGCSASHLDWTMVPYVRKSFCKHYKDGMIYIQNLGLEDFENGYITDETPINSELYTKFKEVYNYALDMTTRELQQAVEGMYHNLNTLQSRSGNQLPFTSINYGTCTLPEGRMVTKALLEGSIKGVGKLHKTPIFPCGIFQCMNGVNRKPGDPNYDLFKLALESTAKRLYPNYANVDWSTNAGYDKNDPNTYVSTMGKRKLQPM